MTAGKPLECDASGGSPLGVPVKDESAHAGGWINRPGLTKREWASALFHAAMLAHGTPINAANVAERAVREADDWLAANERD